MPRRLPSFLALFVLLGGGLIAAPSAELAAALADFRTAGPEGWAFTQKVATAERSRVETFDPSQPDHQKLTLVSENGRPPTEDELASYREHQADRPAGFAAPDVLAPLDLPTGTRTAVDGAFEVWQFELVPADEDDTAAAHMRVHLRFHVPTATIARIELATFEPFSPNFGVKIESARTVIDYSLPAEETPSLLQRITVTIRGSAFWFKSLDSDMTVEYSDHRYVGPPASS